MFFNTERFEDGSLQITWYIASGKRCVDDVRDGWQEDVKVFTQDVYRVKCVFFHYLIFWYFTNVHNLQQAQGEKSSWQCHEITVS